MPIREVEVVKAVETWFSNNGYAAKSVRVGATGFDIEATRGADERWVVEAKGGASSGKDASNAACSSIAMAFMSAAAWTLRSDLEGCRVAIAVPRSRWFDLHVDRIGDVLSKLGITVFQVDDDKNVRVRPAHQVG